ncbi:hypothetical protein DB30_03004 [Enhygromyxa salina]|uniref:Uncharacterized protein n=1 Tax=Enhygromyxa salina TaxID=215803 RepID=A0A0C1ZJU9_9BACT|nr:hypothetical protein [Enhygromyxa salina]KIG17729.1 hypothetical protein DB30_03004 [Enhygromyxa salina]
MSLEITPADRATFYAAALRLLRFVEGRAPTQRRFGPDADALWKGFAGGLETRDRVDILLRDADVAWPGAFGARATFDLRSVAEDDAFGSAWVSLEPMEGEKVWRSVVREPAPTDVNQTLTAIAASWGLKLGAHELAKPSPGTKLIIGGASAIAAALRAFADDDTLSWPTQVIVVADHPGERQLACAAAAVVNTDTASRLRTSGDHDRTNLAGYQPLVSSDASPEVRATIEALTAK